MESKCTKNKKLFQKKKNSSFVSGMVRAVEKMKYCSVGQSACHIYFASSIETLKK